MATDHWEPEKSPGGRFIQQHVRDAAASIALKLERVSWVIDLAKEEDKYILTIYASAGVNEVAFSRAEIESCSRSVSAAVASKIIQALSDIG